VRDRPRGGRAGRLGDLGLIVFERFTPPTRQVVVRAHDEALALKHDAIGTEHLLLGLLEGDGIAARVLGELGVGAEAVREQVSRIVGSGTPQRAGSQLPFTPRAQRVLEAASEEATALEHAYVGSEHVLLGLVREADSVAVQILRDDLGVPPERVRERVISALGG
jgi:ATP-dependent Clp protease ATP-binding subunit ClpC